MPREIPAVRILPMSDKEKSFRTRSIEDVQQICFLRELPEMDGRYRYRKTGLSADPGTVVLFQYKARIIANAVFLRDDKFDRPVGGHGGALYFDPKSFRVFDPVDVETMRKAWPSFRGFGHVKQALNPLRYRDFTRRLKNVVAPAT